MTAQPSQETVKPETIEFAEQLYALGWDSPTDAQWRKLDAFLPSYTQRIEAAATQKLEAEKAELQREVERKHLEGISMVNRQREHDQQVITSLRSQLEGMTKALENIRDKASNNPGAFAVSIDGICFAALTTQPQPVAGQKEGALENLNEISSVECPPEIASVISKNLFKLL